MLKLDKYSLNFTLYLARMAHKNNINSIEDIKDLCETQIFSILGNPPQSDKIGERIDSISTFLAEKVYNTKKMKEKRENPSIDNLQHNLFTCSSLNEKEDHIDYIQETAENSKPQSEQKEYKLRSKDKTTNK
jgi:hypothetical protein